jgi:hypothetical protein
MVALPKPGRPIAGRGDVPDASSCLELRKQARRNACGGRKVLF